MYAQDSPEAKKNLASIDSKLSELDNLFLNFCSQQGYQFSRNLQIWPLRRVWRRQEIDRCIDLVMALPFQEALDRGFYPGFPWSLYASGLLHPGTDPDIHILSRPIFERVPYHQLASVLIDGLVAGLNILSTLTEDEILMRGLNKDENFKQGQDERESYRRSQEAARRTKI